MSGMRRVRRGRIAALAAALAAGAALGACGGEARQMGDHGATVDSVRETATARTHGTGGDSAATELRAPAKLASLEQHLSRMRQDPRAAAENMTSYKFMLADVTDAMTEDLARMANVDSAGFVEQRDAVMDEVGGGPGSSASLDPSRFGEHADRVERLVATYRRLTETARPAS